MKVSIRWMIRSDLPEVLTIEQLAYVNPFTEEGITELLRERTTVAFVAVASGYVVGYLIYRVRKTHLECVNLTVHPNLWRRKIGEQLIDKLKAKLTGHKRDKIKIAIAERNLPAQLFLRSQGFRATAIAEVDDDRDYVFEYDKATANRISPHYAQNDAGSTNAT